MAKKKRNQKTPEDFLKDPHLLACYARLKEKFGENYEKLIVSDLLDDQGHQYVNLVQKGGGVLGVALVGYTQVLEKVGIRFLRMAGTSAGAINTGLMVAVGNKQDAKSEKILDYMMKLDLFSFVDGHKVAQVLIKNFITHKNFVKKLVQYLGVLFLSLGLFILLDIVFLGLRQYCPCASGLAGLSFVLTGFVVAVILALAAYSNYIFSRFQICGFGINPGKAFYEWVKNRMVENGIHTTEDLNKKASAPVPGLNIRNGRTDDQDLDGDVTFITSELVTSNKFEFPKMANLLRVDPNELHPAHFIRASMSIPIFFESHIVKDIPVKDQRIIDAWDYHFKMEKTHIPETVRFVDGGILSNFPINIFYKPGITEPRLPYFGIDLDDAEESSTKSKDVASWSLATFAGKLFNTVRYYYDKDFLLKNYVFKKGIGVIKLSDFNWLNFFISDEDKLKMYIRGAQAATEFLLQFDWQDYKKERAKI